MTMVQAGLFENVAATSQSQTREAKYHRAYRSNPENRQRINSQKKRRRLLNLHPTRAWATSNLSISGC